MSTDNHSTRARDLYVRRDAQKGALLMCTTTTGRAEWATSGFPTTEEDHGFRTKQGADLVDNDVVSQIGSAAGPSGIGVNGMSGGAYSRSELNGLAMGNGSDSSNGASALADPSFPADGGAIAVGNGGTGAGQNAPVANGGGAVAIGSYFLGTRISPATQLGAVAQYGGVAIGAGSSADEFGVAVGLYARALAEGAVSVGAQSSGSGVAVGAEANSGAFESNVAVGEDSSVVGPRSTVVGVNGTLSGSGQTALGNSVTSSHNDTLCLLGGVASGAATSQTEFSGHSYIGGGGDYRVDIGASDSGAVFAGYASDSVGAGFYCRQGNSQIPTPGPIAATQMRSGGIVYFDDSYTYTTGDVGNPYTMPLAANVYQDGMKPGHTWTFSTVNLGTDSVTIDPYSATSSVIGLVLAAGWTLYPSTTSLRLNPECTDHWRVTVRQITPSVELELNRLTPLTNTPTTWDGTGLFMTTEPEGTLVVDVTTPPTATVYTTTTAAKSVPSLTFSGGTLLMLKAPGKKQNWELATT